MGHYLIAPAKTFFHSEFELDALYSYGLLQSGPTHCTIVGMGETFQDAGEVTFPDDEAARHKIIDFTGDLALLSTNGNDGLPIGHYVAWNADHVLQLRDDLNNYFKNMPFKRLLGKPKKNRSTN